MLLGDDSLEEIEYMTEVDRAAAIRGKIIRFAWTEGPTKYLASSGYTLTVVLNFGDQQLVGFASSGKEWYPVRGTFQVVR